MATVSDLVATARAVAYARSLQQKREAEIASYQQQQPSSDQATVVSLSGNKFFSELEKHLSDYRSGKGELSKNTAIKIQQLDESVSSTLQGLGPKTYLNYSAYGSVMSYERRARYIANVYQFTKSIASIRDH